MRILEEEEDTEVNKQRQETCKEKMIIDKTTHNINDVVNVKDLGGSNNESDKLIGSIIAKQMRKD